MKKTYNINLAGYPFIIDEDAYQLLKDYLDTIRYAFETEDDPEDLAGDIESRIAEILIEKESGNVRIVSLEEISKVIERIGRPSDFMDVDESMQSSEKVTGEEEIYVEAEPVTPPPYEPQGSKIFNNPFRKKLFRDPQNSMVGGVCSGLAYYLNIDVTIVRLLTVLLFFLSATTVSIVYIVLWIVVPPADTPLQRMKMMGEDPTVENIGKTVTENFQDNGMQPNSNTKKGSFSSFLNTVFSIFVKCLIVLGLIICSPILIALCAGLIGCVIAVFVIGLVILGGISSGPYGMFDSTQECLMVFYILLAVIGGIITIGVPLWLVFRKLWKKNDSNVSPSNRKTMLFVWLCGIALLSVFTVKAVKKGEELDRDEIRAKVEKLDNLGIEEKNIEELKIDESGLVVKDKKGRKVMINNGGVTIEMEESTDTIISQEKTVDSDLSDIATSDSISQKILEKDTIK